MINLGEPRDQKRFALWAIKLAVTACAWILTYQWFGIRLVVVLFAFRFARAIDIEGVK